MTAFGQIPLCRRVLICDGGKLFFGIRESACIEQAKALIENFQHRFKALIYIGKHRFVDDDGFPATNNGQPGDFTHRKCGVDSLTSGFRDHHIGAERLVGAFEPGGQIDGIPQHGIIETTG